MLCALAGHNKDCKYLNILGLTKTVCAINYKKTLEVYMKLCYTMSVRQLIFNEVTYQLNSIQKCIKLSNQGIKKLLMKQCIRDRPMHL